MYLLRLNRFITKTWRGRRYVRGRIYEVTDHALYLEMLSTDFFVEEIPTTPNPPPASVPKLNRQIMVIRDGGLGDVLLALPAVQEFQSRHPDLEVTFAVGDGLVELIRAQPDIAQVIPYTQRTAAGIRNVVNLCWYVERHREQRRITRALLFAHELGISITEKQLPGMRRALRVLEDWKAGPRETLQMAGHRAGEPLVVLTARGSTPIRSHDRGLLEAVGERLATLGAWVAVVDPDPSQGFSGERIVDFAGKTSVAALAGLASMAECVIGPDTGVVHMAGLLGVPIVAIFTTWPSKLRLTGYDAIALEPEGLDCFPCFDHGCEPHWCTGMIHPDQVVSAVARVLAPKFRLAACAAIDGSFDDQLIFGNPRSK